MVEIRGASDISPECDQIPRCAILPGQWHMIPSVTPSFGIARRTSSVASRPYRWIENTGIIQYWEGRKERNRASCIPAELIHTPKVCFRCPL